MLARCLGFLAAVLLTTTSAHAATTGVLQATIPSSSSETNAARAETGQHGPGEGDVLLRGGATVRVDALVSPREWWPLLTATDLHRAYTAATCTVIFHHEDCSMDRPSYAAWVVDFRLHAPWIAEVMTVSDHRHYWIDTSALYDPCLGGSVKLGPHAPVAGC